MKKDFKIPVSTNVGLAIVKHDEDDYYEAYIINQKDVAIEQIMVNISAYKDDKKTSDMRRVIKVMPANTGEKIENILPEVLEFKTTYLISYFIDNTLYDKKIIVENPDFSTSTLISPIGKEGIMLW
tara:strand:+ start:498917 stop:499294 length:378 start_codon:yes stop_codon:yes gene_type:complete